MNKRTAPRRMLKTLLATFLSVLFCVSAQADVRKVNGDVNSPNGQFSVGVNKNVFIANAAGSRVATLFVDAVGAVDSYGYCVSWSPNSNAVAVIEQYPRGAGLLVATRNNGGWTSKIINDQPVSEQAYAKFGEQHQKTVESKRFVGWVAPNQFRVSVVATYRDEKPLSFSYTVRLGGEAPVCTLD